MRPTQAPSSDCVRIASIETQLPNQKQYEAIVKDYASSGMPTEGGYSFGCDKLEFRILPPTPAAKARTVVYWEVKGNIQDIYSKLLKQQELYGPLKTPTPDGLQDSQGHNTERGLLLDKSTNIPVGLVINPPYPRSKSGGNGGIGLFGDTISYEAAATLVSVGLALGLAFWWLLGRRSYRK